MDLENRNNKDKQGRSNIDLVQEPAQSRSNIDEVLKE
jgi:hypothetical protein